MLDAVYRANGYTVGLFSSPHLIDLGEMIRVNGVNLSMPELVAFMHSMVGLAAVFIAIAAVLEPHALNITAKGTEIPVGNRLELFLGAAIGAITFSGSVIAFGKLSGQYKFRLFQGAPIVFSGQHLIGFFIACHQVETPAAASG